MADETLTLALHGEVSLGTFAEAMVHWQRLVEALTDAIAPGRQIRWVIEELAAGSATATVRAVGDAVAAVTVVDAYQKVGEALSQGRIEMLPVPAARSEAVALTSLINGEVEFVRFETASRDLIIATNYDALLETKHAPLQLPALPPAIGGVRGRIQTLTSRGPLRFTLYDTLYDRAVGCYLAEGQEEIMRDYWGQTALVEGVVTRDPKSGRPLTIRRVRNVTPVRLVDRAAYLGARGAVQRRVDDHRLPEELVSSSRDE